MSGASCAHAQKRARGHRRVVPDGGDRVLAIHTASMEKNGESHTQTDALLFSFADGKVAEIQDFFVDIAMNDRLYS